MEKHELSQLTQWIKAQHPKLIYRIDIAADVKLSIGQAKKNKALQMTKKGYPDIFIAKAKKGYYGLFIELKRTGTVLYNKDCKLRKDSHLEEQQEMINRLTDEGYLAMFVVGVLKAIDVITWYLSED